MRTDSDYQDQYRGVAAIILDEKVKISKNVVFFDHNSPGMARHGLIFVYNLAYVLINISRKFGAAYSGIQGPKSQKIVEKTRK